MKTSISERKLAVPTNSTYRGFTVFDPALRSSFLCKQNFPELIITPILSDHQLRYELTLFFILLTKSTSKSEGLIKYKCVNKA